MHDSNWSFKELKQFKRKEKLALSFVQVASAFLFVFMAVFHSFTLVTWFCRAMKLKLST
jgi:hypothetical protein